MNYIAIIIVFLLPSSILATTSLESSDCLNLKILNQNVQVQDLQSLQSKIIKSSCLDFYQEYFDYFGKSPKVNQLINGVNLKGSKEELNFLKKMIGLEPVGSWEKAKECETVVCALAKVYNSEEAAYRSLNIAKREGYIVSIGKDFYKEESSNNLFSKTNFNSTHDVSKQKGIGQIFNLEEIKKIDINFKSLPKKFKNLKSLEFLRRFPDGEKSSALENARALANSPTIYKSYIRTQGEILFTKKAFESDGTGLDDCVILHELMHHYDNNSNGTKKSDDAKFRSFSGWKNSPGWSYSSKALFVSDYASTNPSEEFAENASFYICYPNRFKLISPEKYQFYKENFFEGKEYIDQFDQSTSDVLDSCIKNHQRFTIATFSEGRSAFYRIQPTCLDSYMTKMLKGSKECNLDYSKLKSYLFDSIFPEVDAIHTDLKLCSEKIELNQKKCFEDLNFSEKCPIEKCELKNSNFKDNVDYSNHLNNQNEMLEKLLSNLGREKFLETVIVSGLSNFKYNKQFPLNFQSGFFDRATDGLIKRFQADNETFKSTENFRRFVFNYIMTDYQKSNFDNFETLVLQKTTSADEDNLKLINDWLENYKLKNKDLFLRMVAFLSNINK